MTRNEKELYRNSPTIGSYCICNYGGIAVKGIEYGIDDIPDNLLNLSINGIYNTPTMLRIDLEEN